MAARPKRRLTTIFYADAVHFGRQMARDETGTMVRLQNSRKIMRDAFADFGGDELNTWGDAIIAEFNSVVEAVRCAVAVQADIAAAKKDGKPIIEFRIGINTGDVMVTDGSLYGEGVNIAARLESLSEAGGVLVSEQVYRYCAKFLALGFDPIGEVVGKEGDDAVVAYRVRLDGSNAPISPKMRESGPHSGSDRVSAPSKKTPKSPKRAEEKPAIQEDVKPVGSPGAAAVGEFKAWWLRQPKSVQTASATLGTLFTINAMFTGLATPWFLFPAIPLMGIIFMRRR
ncbi:MAG: adenylate/guanylate cyclase domain-containing protein [Pseudomonadota bacterium]